MADATAAERKRRQRQRQKAAGDLVRAFLLAVVADAKAAVEDPKVKVAPFILAVADQALVLLERLDAAVTLDAGSGNGAAISAIYLTHGAMTTDDRAALAEHHEASFRQWLDEPGHVPESVTRAVKSAKVQQAEVSLAWAEAERLAKRGTSPVLRQGLRSATLLIRARGASETVEAFKRYTSAIHSLSVASLGDGIDPPYGAIA